MFTQQAEALWKKLGSGKKMTLATGLGNHITARTMSLVVYGNALYFQTDSGMQKARQLKANPNAALCWDNIQLEGHCEAMGHPLLPQNSFFALRYKELYPASYEKYTANPAETLYCFNPTHAQLWCYTNEGKPYVLTLDFETQTSTKTPYPTFTP